MPFTIPNVGAASFSHQAMLNSADIDVIVAGISGQNGVGTGCQVSPTGAANGQVAVATGTVLVNGVYVNVGAGNVSIIANSSGNPRRDLVTVDNTGLKLVVAGTPGAVPLLPVIPANRTVLAEVYVPNGHTASSTITAGAITDKRLFVPSSDFEAHNVLQYGAIGNSNHLTGGGADDTAAIQAAYDAAQATSGFGVVVFPAGRTYRITDTISVNPNPAQFPVWTWGVGGFGGNHVISQPNIVWDGVQDGVMMEALVSGQNLPGALFRNIRLAGRNIAGTGVWLGPTSTNNAAVDTGTAFDEVHLGSFRGNGIHTAGVGATNFWIRGGRWDAIGGYGLYMRADGPIVLNISAVTWDCNATASGILPKGFMHLDGTNMLADGYSMIHLDTVHTEVQQEMFQTDTGGADPADTRGVFQFTCNPTNQRTQFYVTADNIRSTGWNSGRASHSVFQMLGGTLAQRTARLSLNVRALRPVFGDGTAATGHCIPIGNITSSKQPHKTLSPIPGSYNQLIYAPGGDNLFSGEKAVVHEVLA